MNLAELTWDDASYAQFLTYLKSLADADYKAFHERITPGVQNVLGVSTLKLKQLFKELKHGDLASAAAHLKQGKSYEERMLYGMSVPVLYRRDFDAFVRAVDAYAAEIDTWAICDGFVSAIRPVVVSHKEQMVLKVEEYLASDKPFVVRFGFVIMNACYADEPYLDWVFARCAACVSEHYYVKMAVAWLVSTCYVRRPDKTYSFIKNGLADEFTRRKAVSKICDSKRVTPIQKKSVKELV